MPTNFNGLTSGWQQSVNTELTRHNTAQVEKNIAQKQAAWSAEESAKEANAVLAKQLAATQLALKESQELVLDWQSAMEAWKDLAQVLRDEIKECPNHEAHGFGKNQVARQQRILTKEDEARVSRKLTPRYTPQEKGLATH
jgi:hypothetical protein